MVTVTNAEIDEAILSYNAPAASGGHEAPVQISHDDKVPAQAWISKIYRSGNLLLADYKQAATDFVEALSEGRWKKRSVSFYCPAHPNNPTPGKWNIRHLAYVHIPAVKNLANHSEVEPCFSEPEPGILNADFSDPPGAFSFMEWQGVQAFNVVLRMFRAQRETMIAANGIESADKVFPEESLTALAEILSGSISEYVTYEQLRAVENRTDARLRAVLQIVDQKLERINMAEPNASPTNPVNPSNPQMVPMARFEELQTNVAEYAETVTQLQTQLQQYAEIAKTLQTENKTLTTANTDLTTKLTTLTQYTEEILQARSAEKAASFVETLVSQGRVHSDDRQGEIDMLLSLDNVTKTDYTEADGVVQRTQRELYMNRLASRKPMFSAAPIKVDLTEPLPATPAQTGADEAAVSFTEESERNYGAITKYMADHTVSMTEAISALNISL